MNDCRLDHLVVAAADLNSGREYIEDLLGVQTEAGGRHRAMGTHNRLLRLGADQYLEIIAIDPDAAPPGRPRWFGLDDPALRARIQAAPTLVAWVARTASLDTNAARAPYVATEIGDWARDDLRWRLTVPPDGGLLGEGALPLLIEWRTRQTPPQRLSDRGCSLERFVVHTPRVPEVQALFQGLNLVGVQAEHADRTGLVATLCTPTRGDIVLSSIAAVAPDKHQ